MPTSQRKFFPYLHQAAQFASKAALRRPRDDGTSDSKRTDQSYFLETQGVRIGLDQRRDGEAA
jgi:hypothetical protein